MSAVIEFELVNPAIEFVTSENSRVHRSVLPSGLRILTEEVPTSKSVSLGYWVGVGSRDEDQVGFGATHFLEHLLFKSTANRTPLEISTAFDAIGGEHNAITSPEYTCYLATIRATDLPVAVSVLSDMITTAQLKIDEFETERQVILEELAMSDDDPEDAVHTRIYAQLLGDHPIGRPVGGSQETITKVDRDSVWQHYQRFYRPEQLVITAAGNLKHQDLVDLVVKELNLTGWLADPGQPVRNRSTKAVKLTPAAKALQVEQRSTEQVNLVLAYPGLTKMSPKRFALALLSSALGGGMSSRLFQEVREKRGLAYSVYSFASGYSDVGIFGAYAGTNAKNAANVLELIKSEHDKLRHKGLTAAELELVKGQFAGQLALGSESNRFRMSRLGQAELMSGEFLDHDALVSRTFKVSLADIAELSSELFSNTATVSVVGDISADVFDG